MGLRSSLLAVILAISGLPLAAQWKELPQTGSQPERLEDRTVLAGQSGTSPEFAAWLVEPQANARDRRAVVEVHTEGINLVGTASGQAPELDEGRIRYQLNGQNPIYSNSTGMIFDNLSPGKHVILVALVGNDNHLIWAEQTLTVWIP